MTVTLKFIFSRFEGKEFEMEKVSMPLCDVVDGTSCTILDVAIGGPLGQRLCDMGLCPGTTLTFIRSAPLFDPIHIRIGRYHVALRREEAKFVRVCQNAA